MNDQYSQDNYSIEEELSNAQSRIIQLEEKIKSGNQIIWLFIWWIVFFLFLILNYPVNYDQEIEELKQKDEQLENFINQNSELTRTIVKDFIRK